MNLVKSVRAAEERGRKHRAWMVFLVLLCFGLLVVSGYNVFVKLSAMERTISLEREKLKRIEAEYRNYQETQSIVDKEDIELLNALLMSRVYWTKKLEAMASHLPEEQPISYWITRFGYRAPVFTVQGNGYITGKQEQLLTLDDYLTKLRADQNYSDVLGQTQLKSAVRSDEDNRERVSFEYISIRKGGK
jgi:predicted ATPase